MFLKAVFKKRIIDQFNIRFIKNFSQMNKHWIRIISDRETEKLVKSINPEQLSVLEISGERWENLFKYKDYENKFYPEFDLMNIDSSGKKYDLIILEHVLEHLSHPYHAIQNIRKILKIKGHLLLTTPFLVRVHNAPIDCTRWTDIGLKYFIQDCGFLPKNIIIGKWGNKSCIKANFDSWVKYNPFLHSLKNDKSFPAVIWCLAKK